MAGRNNAELRNPVKDSIKICFVGATKAGNEWGRSSPLQIKQAAQNKQEAAQAKKELSSHVPSDSALVRE